MGSDVARRTSSYCGTVRQEARVRVPVEPNLQRKILGSISSINNFVAYLDAIGEIDGTRCIIDSKTTILPVFG